MSRLYCRNRREDRKAKTAVLLCFRRRWRCAPPSGLRLVSLDATLDLIAEMKRLVSKNKELMVQSLFLTP